MSRKNLFLISLVVTAGLVLVACAGPPGPQGPQGLQGPAGPQGPVGEVSAGLTEEQSAALDAAVSLSGIQFPDLDEVRRGCPACHVLINDETGQFTLPYEAHERAEARGRTHPEIAPDGTSLAVAEEVNVTTCLQCHATGSDSRAGMGVIAPLSLRDIVHPAHMNSQFFKLHYGGNCFTCHNVNGDGGWDLLTEQVNVNDKGVPDPGSLPIPGAVPIGAVEAAPASTGTGSASRGGRLYDHWISETGAAVPSSDQPLWALQTTNTRSGDVTWRCKECHGWDYKGAAGAYGSCSHFTGFPGVMSAASKSQDELVGIISGEVNSDHDFSAMGDGAILDLVAFLQNGMMDYTLLIEEGSKNVSGGNTAHGEELFASCASCHGQDGRLLNFGSEEEPEYVGTLAVDNPWEFLHKVRAGHPGSAMPASMDGSWSQEDLRDLLAFSQTLPVEAP
jgi:mono/diheme cytochrome c family protein